ncbi:Transducin/WD40 repeat-like superfamily protein [Zea mays]|uniref:Transducin/WD40 repeat-like superfamily protein n=1 Tax=Zea mays TaxID=4577 RepID=A0A1D6L9N3_MAIZE|nr:Transducin/WD40 repeat-like superfamily protein [Zea mays]
MAPQYQAATLIASPSYPSAIAWSSDNLVAVASGHIVTILNPSALDGPRGLVGLCRSDPFPIGLVNREDLLEPCLLSTSLARETEPCARSISWSQQGFAPNSGCLLAVCTMDGHVKLYRSPIWELCDEWVEVADISQLLFNYYKLINFGEDNGSHLTSLKNTNTGETEVLGSAYELQESLYFRCPGQRKLKRSRVDGFIYDVNEVDLDASKDADFSIEPCSKSKKKYLKKTVKPRHEVVAVNERNNTGNIKGSLSSNGENKSLPLITAKQYACRAAHLSSLVVSWSPVVSSSDKTSCLLRHWCIIAVGSKSGNLSFWKLPKPEYYTIDAGVVTSDPMLIGVLQAHKSCVSVIAWQVLSAGSSKSSLLLATGCSDGSVKIWLGNIEGLNQCASGEVPFALVAVVATDLSSPVSSISLAIPAQSQHEVSLAIGRVSGSLEIWIWNASSNKIEIFSAWHAHDQVVTGLQWAMDGYCLFSCSQDNSARCWISHENHLEEIFMHSNFPELRESADVKLVDT